MRRLVAPFTAVLLVLSSFALTARTPPRPQSAAQAPVPGTQAPGAAVPGRVEGPPRDPAAPADTGSAVIRGRVVALDTGLPLRRVQVQARSTDRSSGVRAAFSDEVGRFELRELAPGRYSVSAALTGYLTLQHGQRRPFDQGRPIAVADGQVVADVTFALPRGVGTAFIDRDWTFEVTNITGTGRLHVQTPSGWALRRIIVQGQDVTDRVLDFGRGDIAAMAIELTQNLTTVSGVVMNARGEPERDYVVIVFADDPDRWAMPSRFLARARADDADRFELRGLPPGRYLAVALEYLEEGAETNVARLEALRLASTASRFTLDEGESRTLSLRLWDGF
jgi:hypothetical protein